MNSTDSYGLDGVTSKIEEFDENIEEFEEKLENEYLSEVEDFDFEDYSNNDAFDLASTARELRSEIYGDLFRVVEEYCEEAAEVNKELSENELEEQYLPGEAEWYEEFVEDSDLEESEEVPESPLGYVSDAAQQLIDKRQKVFEKMSYRAQDVKSVTGVDMDFTPEPGWRIPENDQSVRMYN